MCDVQLLPNNHYITHIRETLLAGFNMPYSHYIMISCAARKFAVVREFDDMARIFM